MEEKGIGRPSTYAPTISTITSHEYVVKDGKYLKPTNLGEIVTQLMEERFPDIVDLKFTNHMEEELDEVESGKLYWKELLRSFYGDFSTELEEAEKALDGVRIKVPDELSDEYCDVCGRQMVVKSGRFGKFLACPGFPDCKNTKPYLEKIGVPCPKCGKEVILRKTKKGRKYYGCENNPECDFMSWQKPSAKKCPQCGGYMLEKGNKLVCADEQCGYVEAREKKDED